ncbi:MAG TPA: DNA repair protein RadC [Planctomycetota bacterium]|jgi:DNA repair protein RadC
MSEKRGDLKHFFHALQRSTRARANSALTPLLKRWRYTQSSEYGDLPLKPGTARFLVRCGCMNTSADAAAMRKEYHELLLRISRATGDAPGVVGAWLDLFSEGEYGVMEDGICAPQPHCEQCGLQAECRYLASGGKDARVFGQSLAQDLLLATRGSGDLRVADMLAFVLTGERSNAVDIARAEALLKACQGLRGLFLAKPDALREMGLDALAIARLQALGELCRAWAGERAQKGRAFAHGKDFYEEFHLQLRDLKKEVFIVVALDQKNCMLAQEQVSEGSLTETLVHPREVFANAIALRAAAVALVHNHPSGDPAPSPADKALTKRLAAVATIVGIRLLDHVVVGDARYFSFVEEGIMG